MKLKWYFTPGWIVRVPLMVGLLAGGALLDGKVPSFITMSMLVGGLFLLVHGWAATFVNTRRVNREVEETEKERLRKLDRETEEYFRNEHVRGRT